VITASWPMRHRVRCLRSRRAAATLPWWTPGVALFKDVWARPTLGGLSGVGGAKGDRGFARRPRLFVAARPVMAFNVATGDRSEIACGCRPSGLLRMGMRSA